MFTIEGKRSEKTMVDSQRTGEFLAALRRAAGYTQQEVADYLLITNKTVSKWESGAGLPEVGILPAVAELYQVTVDELLAGRRLERPKQSGCEAVQEDGGGTAAGRNSGENVQVRRQWLMEQTQRTFRAGLIVLWSSAILGLAVLMILNGVLKERIYPVCFGIIWVLLEATGICLFWNNMKHRITAASQENQETEEKTWVRQHRGRMRLLLPVILSASVLLPFLLLEICMIPAPLGGSFQAVRSGTVKEELIRALYQGTVLFGGWEVSWESLQSLFNPELHLYLTAGGFLMLLPFSLFCGSGLWMLVNCLEYVVHEKRMAASGCGENEGEAGRCLIRTGKRILVMAAAVAAVFAVGRFWEQKKTVSVEVYENQQEFERFVKDYLEIYSSYQAYQEEKSWPELNDGVERIDNTYLDGVLNRTERTEPYRGVIGFDYASRRVYRVLDWEKRLEMRSRNVLLHMIVSAAALSGIWLYYAGQVKRKSCNLL